MINNLYPSFKNSKKVLLKFSNNRIEWRIYLFTAHIFFDDAFTKHTNKKGERYMVNDYVKALVNCVPEACR